MYVEPRVVLGKRFAKMHERFDVNKTELTHILGKIGLLDEEIGDFFVIFEDRFLKLTFGLTQPGMGWSRPKYENGIHVTGLDDFGILMHPSPEVYGHTILHEIGHTDHARRKPHARYRENWDERVADRFARKNAHIMADLVDYEINTDEVARIVEKTRSYNDKTAHYEYHQQQADKILLNALG